ncbi:unnamed protein product [Thlaspi arvense]|uniref:RRM domain-containing protein n=1 Tax=Thlaspi arvense TaxID=13288 RepID=A0AAU9R981_THLAR|nr:unnamed protein product [Thlaspi arvense]
MDPDDPTSIVFTKIRTLEPENAPKIIGYFLLQDMEQSDLIRIAFGPDTLLQTFCRKAKSDLGLSSNGFSHNPTSRPINIHRQPLSQSSPRNGFLEFSRNPNPLSPSLTSGTLNTNPNFDSSPFRDGSSLIASSSGDFVDEQLQQRQLSNHFSFLNDEDPFANFHKRSFSANDVCLESEEPGFGGGGYRFPQAGLGDDFGSSGDFRSPSERGYDCLQREEMMLMKLAQQQRMAAARFLLQTQGSGQFGEEGGHYYSPGRHERDDSVSRQIYLTFPSESSFTDTDVSCYFSNFGTVEDVRIPYQQQRMYGFVTFANAETVRTILARGNPHFICDSRVLVKPYKEKGKILHIKRQQQQLQQLIERGNYSPSSSPSGMDLYDCHLGPRMFSNSTHEMLRRKAEQEADLQQAIEVELQRRRFLNLQLPDLENEPIHHLHRSLSIGSRAHFPPRFNQSLLFQPENNIGETTEGDNHLQLGANSNEERGYSNDLYNGQETDLENTLPESLFGSPKKSDENHQTKFDTEQDKAASSEQSA